MPAFPFRSSPRIFTWLPPEQWPAHPATMSTRRRSDRRAFSHRPQLRRYVFAVILAKRSEGLLPSASTAALCIRCHTAEAKLAGGQHDSTAANTAAKTSFQTRADNRKDLCAACHRAHGNDAQNQLWTVQPMQGQLASDGVCVACHANQGFSAGAVAEIGRAHV